MLDSLSENIKRTNALYIEGRAYIDGQYAISSSNHTVACYSPIDNRFLQNIYFCDESDVNLAVCSARRCFTDGTWSRKVPRERKQVLKRWAALLHENREELALLETLDSGKPISEVLRVDIPGAIYCLEWFAELIDKTSGQVIPTQDEFLCWVTRESLGVVAAIVPWNYPLLMATWKFAPALAMGNSVILKPSEKTPLTALYIAKLATDAGLPPGAFNVLPGAGEVGALLSQHEDVDCVSFTGSGKTGRQIMIASANSNLKRVWLELGGKSPNIILPDYKDLQHAAESAAAAIFSNAGAICSGGSRLLVHRDIKERMIDYLMDACKLFQPGYPLDPATRVGAVIDAHHLKTVLTAVEQGALEATLLTGGKQVHLPGGGFYMEPSIFDCPHHNVSIAREEIFGPVLSVISFDTIEEAIAIANDTEYGLAGAVWTADMQTALSMANSLRVGTVWVNHYDELTDMNLPFGGWKQSGLGVDNSVHALAKYSELKSTVIRTKASFNEC